MAFPSSSGSTPVSPARGWEQAVILADTIKKRSATVQSICEAGSATATLLLDYGAQLADWREELARLAQIPAMGAYAKAQKNDSEFDVTAEAATLLSAIDMVISGLVAGLPTDPSGWLLVQKMTIDGRHTDRAVTAAQTANLRTSIDALIGTID